MSRCLILDKSWSFSDQSGMMSRDRNLDGPRGFDTATASSNRHDSFALALRVCIRIVCGVPQDLRGSQPVALRSERAKNAVLSTTFACESKLAVNVGAVHACCNTPNTEPETTQEQPISITHLDVRTHLHLRCQNCQPNRPFSHLASSTVAWPSFVAPMIQVPRSY